VTQEDGSNCSIFSFDVAANKARLPMARNAVKKLRTLRHPGVIKVLDTIEVWIFEGDRRKKSY
jgi:SCY1-like protein 1